MSTIGERLRRERERLGYNQTEFGALGGVTKKTQGNYEANERTPDAGYLAGVGKEGADVAYIVTGVRPAEFANVCKLPGDAEESKNENVFVFDAEADRLLICLQALDEVLGREGAMTPDERRAWARGAYHAIGKELPARADLVDWQRFARQLARVTVAMPR